jgi:AcrR family transcriptional regulator
LRVTRTNASAPVRPSLRELKKQRTREAIVEAGLRLFREHGYAATTCDQIAAAAGVSPATFFRYFATKEDVVLQDEYDALIVAMIAARPAEEPPVVAVRNAMAAGFALILPQDEQAIRERILLTLSVPALRARIYEQQQAAEANFAAAIAPRMGCDATELRVRVLAAAISATAVVAMETWAQEGGDLGEVANAALLALEECFG